ncbi:MAG TPA: permease-like cell division protein FtsX [Burkholderiales bacterium]|nr:permease-like cell division protein FtsX [Burkholderiales bacterium]
MRSWLRQHRRALVAALGKLAAQKAGGAVSALVIGVALSLPAGGYALLDGLSSLAAGVALEPQISVYLKSSATKGDADALASRLKADGRIGQLRFVSREQALKELKATEGLADVVDALDHNPLPDAFVVRARDSSPETLAELAQELRRMPSVAHVQADAVWARRLASLTRLGRLAVLLLAALLAFGLVAVTFNTIRLQILTQRDEIEVSKLIGATDAFIRRPFLYLGLLQGLAGGALALGIVWGGLDLLNGEVRTLAQSYGSSFRFAFLSPGDSFAVVLFAGALGWLGASLSVSRYLLEIQPK